MTVTDLTEIADHVEREVREAMRMPTLDAVRAVLNESGIRRARRALAEAPDRLTDAQDAYRQAQAVEQAARDAYSGALLEADWELDGQIHSEGNKRYRWVPCDCTGPDGGETAKVDCPVCTGNGAFRRFMLADDVKAWKASEAARVPAVTAAAEALRRAEENTAAARDSVGVADKRLSAAKYDLQAAVAELNALTIGLTAKENAR